MSLMTATINESSPRHADWLKVFGTNRVPLESPQPHWASAPGIGQALFYKLAVPALAAEQRQRLVAHIAAKSGESPAEVEATIDGEHGVPILADDVCVSVDVRAFL